MQDYDLDAYLGDTTVTDEQRQRIMRETDRIHERWPEDWADDERSTAFDATVAYVLGDITVEEVGMKLSAARLALTEAMVAARQVAHLAIEDGASEAGTARALFVDRMTVRDWLGKR